MFPQNRQMKQEGKLRMGLSMPFWMKATLLLVGLQVLLYVLRGQFGGLLGWYLIPIEKLPDAVTGYTVIERGLELVFRMDALELVAAVSLTYGQIAIFFLINALALLILAPVKLATLERYWLAFRGETQNPPSLLRWYTKPKLLGKSILVSLILDLGCRLLALLALLPSLLVYAYLYSGTWLSAHAEPDLTVSLLALLAMALLVGGALVAFYVYSTLYPIAYCLAAQPDYSMGKVLRRGLDSIRHCRKRFFGFRLSFLPYYILSNLTYGVMDLYILPYISFSSFHFLQEAAKQRPVDAQGQD